jgi:hypothetical protein
MKLFIRRLDVDLHGSVLCVKVGLKYVDIYRRSCVSSHTFKTQFVPVNIRKEHMFFHLLNASGISKSLCGILLKQTFQQVAEVSLDDSRDLQLAVGNVSIHTHLIFVIKRRETDNHLIQQYSQSINVYRVIVRFSQQYFGTHVFWAADKRACHLIWQKVKLAKPEISQLYMACFVDQDVFRLQISVEDVVEV